MSTGPQRPWRLKFIALVLAIAPAGPAWAHEGTGLVGGFVAGLLHPVTGPDHLLAMVAVGIWGAILGRPLLIALPIAFPAVMAIGGVLGILSVPMAPVEIGIALSVLLLGGAILAKVRPPISVAILLVSLFAIFHGYAHGAELPSAADPVGYSAGFVFSTGLLHIAGIVIGLVATRPSGLKFVQGLGAVIASLGVYFLYRAIAG